MNDTIKGYVHYAHYKKDGETYYFEHIDVGYDYEAEYTSLNSEMGQENLRGYLTIVKGAEEILDFGLKEVFIPKLQVFEGTIKENGGQLSDDFAIILKRYGQDDIEIEDFLIRYYMYQKVRFSIQSDGKEDSPAVHILEGRIEENGGQTYEDFAVLLATKEGYLEIEKWLETHYLNQNVILSIEFI